MEHRTSSYALDTVFNSAMRSRVGQMLQLKRMTDLYPRQARANSTESDRTDGSMTPPPSYREEEPLSPVLAPCGRPVSADGSPYSARPPIVDDASGVRWQWASQGYSSLLQAMPDDMPSTRDPRLARVLYLHSLDYILQGLPEDLSEAEVARLRRALPAPLTTRMRTPSQRRPQGMKDDQARQGPSRPPTRLRRSVADILLCVTALISTLAPYIQYVLRQAYRFDRQHNFTERLVVTLILTADAIVRQIIVLARSVCAMNDGKVGDIIQLWCLWLADGIGGGVFDGLTEGLHLMGSVPESRSRRDEPETS